MKFFKREKQTALEAISYAQWIAHAPMVFQSSRVMRNTGVLTALQDSGEEGISFNALMEKTGLPLYGLRVLLESGMGSGILIEESGKYFLTKTGYFILNDEMTRVNMDFVHDVCYKGLYYLEDSINHQKPEGLKVFGDWKSVYEALSELPDHVRKSWLSYDHFYSDDAFSSALPIVFNYKPERILDVGGNTGKWAKSCLSYNENVHVGIVDLPGQIEMAKKNTQEWMESGRISFYATNVLSSEQKLPSGFDIIWMSQFLDCFSEEEMLSILEKCADALSGEGLVMILEPLWDRQRFEAAAFSLQQASLYFTTIANGNSQMYRSDIFLKCISAAGFEVIDHFDHIGRSQSLMVCKKNNSCKK